MRFQHGKTVCIIARGDWTAVRAGAAPIALEPDSVRVEALTVHGEGQCVFCGETSTTFEEVTSD